MIITVKAENLADLALGQIFLIKKVNRETGEIEVEQVNHLVDMEKVYDTLGTI